MSDRQTNAYSPAEVAATLRSDLQEAHRMQEAGQYPAAAGFLTSTVLFAIAHLDPMPPSELKADRWMTVNEVAEYLKVHRTTVYDWMRDGLLPYHELPNGRGRRFDRSEVDGVLHRGS